MCLLIASWSWIARCASPVKRERENRLYLLLLIKIQCGRRFVSRSKSFFSWQEFFICPITPRSSSYPCRLNLSATSSSLSHKSVPPALLWLQLLVSVLPTIKNSNYLATCQEGLPELSVILPHLIATSVLKDIITQTPTPKVQNWLLKETNFPLPPLCASVSSR